MHAYRELQEFEMTSKYNARRCSSTPTQGRYSAVKKCDSNKKQPIYPSVQAENYVSPITTQAVAVPAELEGTAAEEEMNTSDEENVRHLLIMMQSEVTLAPDGYVN